MWAFIIAIQMAVISLVLAQNPFFYSQRQHQPLISITIQNSPSTSSTPQLLRNQTGLRRDDYTYTPGIGGNKFHTRAATWNEARRTCDKEGGHLAIINSITEANVLNKLFHEAGEIIGRTGGSDSALIGFHSLYQEGEYVTIHSQSLAKAGYSEWKSGEPSQTVLGIEENCGSVVKTGGLNDVACDKKYPFICELPIH